MIYDDVPERLDRAKALQMRGRLYVRLDDALCALRGLSQFRTGGYGRFTWERVDRPEAVWQPGRARARGV